MSTRRKVSEWREKRFEWHGEAMQEFLEKTFMVGQTFTASEAANADCLNHLSERYAGDVAIAICSELYNRGILHRQGNRYYFPKKQKAA